MSKLTTILVALVCLFISTAALAQPEFFIQPQDPDATSGQTVTVDVKAKDFVDILTCQFSVHWNSSLLSYQGITNPNMQLGIFPPPAPTNFATFDTANGNLGFIWDNPTAIPQTLPDSAILFSIQLQLLDDAGAESLLTFTGFPVGMEVIEESTPNDPQDITSSTTFTNGPATEAGYGSPPPVDYCDNAVGLTIVAVDDTVSTGETFCIPVYACSWTNVATASYTMEFNPAVMQYSSINIPGNLPQLTQGNFGTTMTANGFIAFSWNDSLGAGVTIPSNTLIYEVCFDAVGAGGSMDTLQFTGSRTPIEFTDGNENMINSSFEDAKILVSGTSSSALQVNVSSATAENGDNVCLDVSVANFNMIGSVQYSMNWDPAILSFDQIMITGNLTPMSLGANFNTSSTLTDQGKLTFSWNSDDSFNGTTVNDGTVIYQLCFDVIGSAGQNSDVSITDDPSMREALQEDGSGTATQIPMINMDGNVNVIGAGGFELHGSDETAEPGDTACVKISVRGFNNLIATTYALEWDDAVIDFLEIRNNTLPPSTGTNQIVNNKLIFQWSDQLSIGVTKPDDEVIYEICFIVVGADGTSSPITFTDHPPQVPSIEILQDPINTMEIPYSLFHGSVNVQSASAVNITQANLTHVNCNGGSDGAIDITVEGGTTPYTFAWSYNSQTTEDLNNIPAGDYTVTITDMDGNTATDTYTITEPTALIIASEFTEPTCNGDSDGSIDITISGGTTVNDYNYDWSDPNYNGTQDPQNVSAGDYTVTITDDNGCTITETVTVTEPDPLAMNEIIEHIGCSGNATGSVTLNVTGGTPGINGYIYDWSDDMFDGQSAATGLGPGDIVHTTTDSLGCRLVMTFTIEDGEPISANASATHVSCGGASDGSINLTVNGGTAPFSFNWTGPTSIGNVEDPTGLSGGDYNVTITDDNGCTSTASATVNEPSAVVASPDISHIDCNGDGDGSINTNASGGTGSFDYEWSNNAGNTPNLSGLDGGNYIVTITDGNGCSLTVNLTVDEPSAIELTANVTSESGTGTMDGAIDLSASGGTPGYSYDWNNGQFSTQDLSNLSQGQYDVIVTDDNGCTSMATYNVNVGDAPEIMVDAINHPSCNGNSNGSIDISVTGGTAPYTYLWNYMNIVTQDINGLPSGMYIVTVTDNNGVTAALATPVILTDPEPMMANFTKTNATCAGVNDGSFNVNVTGGTMPYTYTWDNLGGNQSSYTGLAAGTYNGTVTDANFCTATVSITIDQPGAIFLSNLDVTDAVCAGESSGAIDITPAGGAAPYTFVWTNGGATTEDLTNIPAGNYNVTITDANGCSVISNIITVGEGDAIDITLEGIIDVSCPGVPDGSIDVSISGGVTPYAYMWFNVNVNLGIGNGEDIVDLRGGTYQLKVTDASGCEVMSQPFTVNEPPPLDIDVTITHTSIQNNDGAISVNVSGGNAPYSYNWLNPINGFSSNNEDIFGLLPGYYYLTITDDRGCATTRDSLLVEGVVFAIGEVTHVSCNGENDGAIDMTVMGGIPPFTYDWSPGPNPQTQDRVQLSAGTYTVTITDNAGSEFIETYVITEPDALEFTDITVIHDSGSGGNGSINITMMGGTPPYSYQWSTGAASEDLSNLEKGKYDITVIDSKGCLAIELDIEVEPAPLFANVSTTDASCNSGDMGSATISIIGGCEPYTITLDNGIMTTTTDTEVEIPDLEAGSYTGTIEDLNGNTFNISFAVGEPDPIIVTVDNVVNNNDDSGNNCNGAVSITVTGGAGPYTYQWSNGAIVEDVQGLCEDISPYSVTVTDQNGCTAIGSGIMVRRIIIDVASVKCADDCNGEIILDVMGGGGPYSYEWADGSTDRIRTGLCADTYDVTILDAAGNAVHTSSILVEGPPSALMISLNNMVRPIGTNKDGSIDINVSGGWGNYLFTWTGPDIVLSGSEDQVALGGGVYNVIVEDAGGCQVSLSINLDAIVLILGNVEMNNQSCAGQSLDLCDGSIEIDEITGGIAPYTYEWSNDATGQVITRLCAGQYFVTVTDAQGLTGEFGPFVLVEPEPITLDYVNPGDCSATVLISGGTAPYQIRWNTDNADTTAQISVNNIGPYAVIVTDTNGCTAIDNNVLVSCEDDPGNPNAGICSDRREVITPNGDGENDEFIIRCTETVTLKLEVYNRYGQLVYQSAAYDNTWQGIDEDGDVLPEGGYFFVIEYDDGNVHRQDKGHLTILR